MNKKNITLMVVAVLTLITFVGLATYAYFVGNINTTRTSNVTATTERNNLVFDTNGGVMNLNVSASSMQRSQAGTVAAQNSTTLTVNLTANTDYSMVCTYDIVYEWTSTDKYTSHSSGVNSNEFTIKASLASNSNTYEGTNNIANETDLSSLTYTNNSATVVSGAQIDATGSTRSTAVWTLESKIYNVNANQTNLVNKNFGGRFKITNVLCVTGNVTATLAGPTSYWFDNEEFYTFPNYGGTLKTSGTATGHNVYMGQDATKYYVCLYMDGDEVCLSQPYTQYGLEGHRLYSSFTSEQQNAATAAIGEVFSDAGITGYSCDSSSGIANCGVGDFSCRVDSNGSVNCGGVYAGGICYVDAYGSAFCYGYSSGPTSYWFAKGSTYTFPNYGGTLQTSGPATEHNVYIGQDDTKYYTCKNVDGNEACLSQPYTQYGLEGHTLYSDFTTEQQNAAKAAIGEVFSDAGITEYFCDSDSGNVVCNVIGSVGGFVCYVNNDGTIEWRDYFAGERCFVRAGGSAGCE